VPERLRIFIGTDATQVVAQQVLEYSIRAHASIAVEIVPLRDLPVRVPKDASNQPRTGFTFYRFMIPQLCEHRGRALYLDPDMLVLGDVAELTDITFGDHQILCTHQPAPPPQWKGDPKFRAGLHSAVMLLDCSRLQWDVNELISGLDEDRYTYAELRDLSIFDPSIVGDTIPIEWNHLERYEPGVTRLLHYTVVSTQPWKSDANPLGPLWTSWYEKAVEAGAVCAEDVATSILAGHVKPSLAASLDRAPGASPTLSRALLELGDARAEAVRLERRLAAIEDSQSWAIGNRIVRLLGTRRRRGRDRSRPA
jgi:hypothetical protein